MLQSFTEQDMIGEFPNRLYENPKGNRISDTESEDNQVKRYKKYITPYLSAFIIGPALMIKCRMRC